MGNDLSVKPLAVRAMLTAGQKQIIYQIRELVLQEKSDWYPSMPTEQDLVIRALAQLARRYKVKWPSEPRKTKGNPPRKPEEFQPDRLYSIRAILTENQKNALEELRLTIQKGSEKASGHANLPTEQETVVRALADLTKSKGLEWPLRIPSVRPLWDKKAKSA